MKFNKETSQQTNNRQEYNSLASSSASQHIIQSSPRLPCNPTPTVTSALAHCFCQFLHNFSPPFWSHNVLPFSVHLGSLSILVFQSSFSVSSIRNQVLTIIHRQETSFIRSGVPVSESKKSEEEGVRQVTATAAHKYDRRLLIGELDDTVSGSSVRATKTKKVGRKDNKKRGNKNRSGDMNKNGD